ncbi:MAG: hypothetical protein ABW115_21195 [Candidatus Thiodiazotropha sp. 6PLUC6]
MKTDSSPKPAQRRLIRRQIRHYLKRGGRISKLPNGTARGLCRIKQDDIEILMGVRHEI